MEDERKRTGSKGKQEKKGIEQSNTVELDIIKEEKITDNREENKDDIKKSRWKYGFDYALDILNTLNCKNTYNYEAHLPIIINKQNFLNIMNLPIIREFMTTKKVLHKRSIYKNLYPEYSTAKPKIISDVKITIEKDLDDSWLQGEWLSVFDNTVSNHKQFPVLNHFLYTLFPSKCKYEK